MRLSSEHLRLILTGVTLGVVTALVVMIFGLLLRADEERRGIERIATQIAECTTRPDLRKPPLEDPKPGDCYLRQQARSAELLGEPRGPINTVAVAAAACGAAFPGDVPATLRCTRRALVRQDTRENR